MKITLNGFLYWHKPDYKDQPEFVFRESEGYAASCGPQYVLIGPMTAQGDVPDDFDPIPGQIQSLKKKKQAILAEAEVKANNIEDQIQRMLSIEYKPESAL